MKIKCAHTELVPLANLVPHPKNYNQHSDRQIEMLSKIINFQGQRLPIVVSKRSGFIVAGHGRLMAIQKLGWEKAAVDYQDFTNEAEEHAHMIADNKIAELAEADQSMLSELVVTLGEEFDCELLGMEEALVIDDAYGSDASGTPPDRVSQADVINNFLENDMRYLQLVYPIPMYDLVVARLTEIGKQEGIEDFSTVVANVLGVSIEDTLPEV